MKNIKKLFKCTYFDTNYGFETVEIEVVVYAEILMQALMICLEKYGGYQNSWTIEEIDPDISILYVIKEKNIA